jgi:hypothetical protein
MQAIFSTCLVRISDEPDQWLPDFCEAIGRNKWMAESENSGAGLSCPTVFRDVQPYTPEDGEHIAASRCFRTLYTALNCARAQGF